ncbi:MAG TPA: hypothetical protein EYO59_13535 [Chromatiaceae bacterium]|nr:hypothetical protein [Chromatiaceae bacterium]
MLDTKLANDGAVNTRMLQALERLNALKVPRNKAERTHYKAAALKILISFADDYCQNASTKTNCFFDGNEHGIVCLVLSRKVATGEELLPAYGILYWMENFFRTLSAQGYVKLCSKIRQELASPIRTSLQKYSSLTQFPWDDKILHDIHHTDLIDIALTPHYPGDTLFNGTCARILTHGRIALGIDPKFSLELWVNDQVWEALRDEMTQNAKARIYQAIKNKKIICAKATDLNTALTAEEAREHFSLFMTPARPAPQNSPLMKPAPLGLP